MKNGLDLKSITTKVSWYSWGKFRPTASSFLDF